MGKVIIRLQRLCDAFMTAELHAVVRSQRMYPILERQQQINDCRFQCFRALERQFGHQGETAFAFAKRHDRLTLVLADDGVQLPVADTSSRGDDGRTLVDRRAIGDADCLAAPTAAGTAVTQVQIQTPALAPVLADMAVNAGMADAGHALRLQVEADLLRTPVQTQTVLHRLPA